MELQSEGHTVNFVGVNKDDAESDKSKLASRCSFPLFQDREDVGAWTVHHAGRKDDFFIYGPDGKLVDYLPVNGDLEGKRQVNLSTKDGYSTLKKAILDALDGKAAPSTSAGSGAGGAGGAGGTGGAGGGSGGTGGGA